MFEEEVTTSILSWLLDARRATVPLDSTDGSIRLDFSAAYRVVLAVFTLLVTGTLGGLVWLFRTDPTALTITGVVLGPLWLGFMYGVYDAFFVTLKASSRGLEKRSPIAKLRVLPWESITSVSYATIANWYRFKSEWGWSIRVSIYRSGLKSFSTLVAAHIRRSPAGRTPKDFYKHTAGV
jgi:hypothetical protein